MQTSETDGPRVALITGCARRIGRSLALILARSGWQIGIHFRSSEADALALKREIEACGGTAATLKGDLANADDVLALVPQCVAALGPPTCLINNASEFLVDTPQTVTMAGWDSHLDINLRTPVFLSQALVEALPDGQTANIINIIDQRVWKLTPAFFSYTISKAGLWTATRTLAQALAPRVRVNAIGPGPVLKSIHQTDADFAAEVEATLLKRGPTTDEIAAAVSFILATPSMTGQMIALDGGQHLTWSEEDPSV